MAERIKQGPIPVDEALPIAKQIAEGPGFRNGAFKLSRGNTFDFVPNALSATCL